MKKNFNRLLKAAPYFLVITILAALVATPKKEAEKRIILASTDDLTGLAGTYVLKVVLEERLGWQVDLMSLSVATLYESLAVGEVDALICTWLPVTNQDNYEKIADRVETLSVNLTGPRLGLLVPAYLPINSIDELNEYAANFDYRIIVTDPNSGTVKKTIEAKEIYALHQFDFYGGSEPLALSVIKEALKYRQWFVTVGWTPHSFFAGQNLKFLEDPKKAYGEPESVYTLVSKNLKKDKPKLYHFLKNFYWTATDLQNVLDLNTDETPEFEKAAKQWVQTNSVLVDKWLEGLI